MITSSTVTDGVGAGQRVTARFESPTPPGPGAHVRRDRTRADRWRRRGCWPRRQTDTVEPIGGTDSRETSATATCCTATPCSVTTATRSSTSNERPRPEDPGTIANLEARNAWAENRPPILADLREQVLEEISPDMLDNDLPSAPVRHDDRGRTTALRWRVSSTDPLPRRRFEEDDAGRGARRAETTDSQVDLLVSSWSRSWRAGAATDVEAEVTLLSLRRRQPQRRCSTSPPVRRRRRRRALHRPGQGPGARPSSADTVAARAGRLVGECATYFFSPRSTTLAPFRVWRRPRGDGDDVLVYEETDRAVTGVGDESGATP